MLLYIPDKEYNEFGNLFKFESFDQFNDYLKGQTYTFDTVFNQTFVMIRDILSLRGSCAKFISTDKCYIRLILALLWKAPSKRYAF